MDRNARAGQTAVAKTVSASGIWRRALWMQLGALNGLMAFCVLLIATEAPLSQAVRLAAQVQFMHGMATLACATFMNVGARAARHAPAFFLSGNALFCLPTYAEAVGWTGHSGLPKVAGIGAFGIGWLILIWSARDIDRG